MDDAVILERAIRLANIEMKTVALQLRRIRGIEPEDDDFVFRRLADIRFFIISLNRLRTTATIGYNVSDTKIRCSIIGAVGEFDKALPDLKKLRNIGEHQNEYAVDSPDRRVKTVDRKQLEVDSWSGTEYNWLGARLNFDDAYNAAGKLFTTLQSVSKDLPKS
jgi:hypothetical protein